MRTLNARSVAPAILALLLASATASAQTKTSLVIASVTDGQSGQPVADANVSLSDLNVSAKTDWSGEARITAIAAGQHQFEIRKIGYDPLTVTLMVQGDSIGPVFRLAKSGTPALAPVKVEGDPSTGYLAEFEQRRAQGRGRYLTAADLDKKQNQSLVRVLANSIGGLMSTPDQDRPGKNILMTRKMRPRLTNVDVHCGVDTYLDGQLFQDDLESIKPTDLAGVEYYPIESAPGEYRKLSQNCGVVLLWSRK
jgi:hypothetical protein